MKQKYNEVLTKVPLEFHTMFPKAPMEGYKEVLTQYSRDRIVKLALCLSREYCEKPAMKIRDMLYSNNPKCKNIQTIVGELGKEGAHKGFEYVVAFQNTPLELLRRAFSIPYAKFDADDSPSDINRLQYQTLKLVTQINEKLMSFKINEENAKDISKLIYVNCASFYDILHYDKKNEFLYQFIQAISLFELVENMPQYNPLLKGFYKKYNIKNWREYVRTIFSIFSISKYEEGIIPFNKMIDKDKLITWSILDYISIPTDNDIISYASKDEYDKDGNSDYRAFRDKPLFKTNDGDYFLHSIPLFIDKIYNGLYFDFMHIADTLEGNRINITNLFTSEFVEKTLFGGQMRQCVSNEIYVSKDEDEMKKIYEHKDGELGPPDYYLRGNNSVLLFECKDIRLNGWIKEKRVYELLEQELRNKLVCKTYTLDYKKKCHKVKKPTRIGCGQIAGHLANIRRGSFPWDSSVSKNVCIFRWIPVQSFQPYPFT